jgi:hypothetical protein
VVNGTVKKNITNAAKLTYCIRTGEINTYATASGAQNKAEDFWVTIESIHKSLSPLDTSGTIQPQICVSI